MTSFAVLVVVKATAVCGLALFLSRLCRRTRASVRHVLLLLAFAGLVVIPVASLVLPAVAITMPETVAPPARLPRDVAATVSSSAAVDQPKSGTDSMPRKTQSGLATGAQLMTPAWLAGIAISMAPVVAGLWQLRQLRNGAQEWSDAQEFLRLTFSSDVHRQIDILLHDGVVGPMTCGTMRPAIILPLTARQWNRTSLRCALRHELEHVARRDFLTLCLSRMTCAAYWFHPLVWAMWRHLRLEAERACDDAVLKENDARNYAAFLVSMAQRHSVDVQSPLLAMAGRNDLAARISAVLSDNQERGHVGPSRAAALTVAAAIAICGVASLTIVRAMPQTPTSVTAGLPLGFETMSLRRNHDGDESKSRLYFTEDAGGNAGAGRDGRVQWLIATNVRARLLLLFAFTFQLRVDQGMGGLHQIENAPEWIDADRFDFLAKAPFRATKEQMRQMMQSFVAERFKLTAHVSSKDFPLYALVRSRSDGNPGPRLSPSQIDCGSKAGVSSACGLSSRSGRLAGRGVTMSQLVKVLPNHLSGAHHIMLDRDVIDDTGLRDAFDFTLEWTPDAASREARAPGETAPQSLQFRFFANPVEAKAPNFLAALHEQLGLMFEARWAPQPVLVIDRIEPPEH